MMSPYDSWMIAKQRQRETARRAEIRRLLADAEATAPPSPGLPRRLRVWTGTRLIALGERLAECYEAQPNRVQSVRSTSNS